MVRRRQQNAFLVGRVAVRAIVVNGPAGSAAKFSRSELAGIDAINLRATVILSALAAAQPTPPRIRWALHTTVVPVAAPPLPTATTPSLDPALVGPRETPWRDAALQHLVGQTGAAGLLALRAASIGGADHCISVFWTRYECSFAAYSRDRLAMLVMCWPMIARERQGRGIQVAPRHLAHEICHLFGAPDEYSPCTVLDSTHQVDAFDGYGDLDFPNFNCESTNPSPADCLMRSNTELICPTTAVHLGWVDSNRDGILDVFQ
jgi:hypothetical protein